MLVVVEVSAAIRRQVPRWQPVFSRWQSDVSRWEQDGKVILYTMSREPMEKSVIAARDRRLRGADSVIAALAEELNMPLRTSDNEHLQRVPGASQ